jgi:hypothetical protein
VRVMLLAHNHVSLVARAFLTKAKWDLPPNSRGVTFCDAQGRLSSELVAAHANGKELAELLQEGIECELLSYKWMRRNLLQLQ